MRYQQLDSSSSYPYPNHNIDPSKKTAEWCMQYAKAAFYDWSYTYPKGVLANNGGDYEKYRMYALGKQPNSIYKKMLGVDQATNNTWLTVDWAIRPVVSVYRDKAISRLMKEYFGIVCTPIDALAKNELAQYYAKLKTKLAIRKLMEQTNPELANHPQIALETGEPMDVEELEMRVELGEQFNRAKDAEMAIELGFYENNYIATVRTIYEDLFDFGIAGVKDWLGEDNKAKFRRVNPESAIVSFSKDPTFNDIVHAGELIDVPLVELATLTDKEGNRLFTDQELSEFASSITRQGSNPASLGDTNTWFKPYDKFKCQVLDIEFYTYNTVSYYDATDKGGNAEVRMAEYGRGKKSDKYKRKTIQYVYKCKWIVGTDKCYDWGMCYDQKRPADATKKSKTKLSFKFCAFNFYNMQAQGFMERLVPYADEYQLTVLKIQNFKNRAVPSGWWISLDALERVAINKGGENMTPRELLQMFFETGVLVGRTLDESGAPMFQNTQPVIPINNTAASELAMFYQDLLNTLAMIEKMTGYNDITSGNPNPKTLVPGYELANMSTNDTLYPMAWAAEDITLALAEATMTRMQQGIKKGGISGYAPALNSNSLRFIQLSPDLSLRDYGIEIQKRTSEEQRMWLLGQMQQDIANGFLDSSDAVWIVNCHNVKLAQTIWAHRVKKAKEQIQRNKMQELEAINQGNRESAMLAAQEKERVFMMEAQVTLKEKEMGIMGELKKEEMRILGQLKLEEMKLTAQMQMNTESNLSKLEIADVTADAKVAVGAITGQSKVVTQEIANQKPQSSTKK